MESGLAMNTSVKLPIINMPTSTKSRKSVYYLTFIHWLLLGILAPIGLGWFRYHTGPEWAMILLFLLPVILNTWYAGKVAGLFTSLTCALAWLMADIIMDYDFSLDYILGSSPYRVGEFQGFL
jgi:hypothetical protein